MTLTRHHASPSFLLIERQIHFRHAVPKNSQKSVYISSTNRRLIAHLGAVEKLATA